MNCLLCQSDQCLVVSDHCPGYFGGRHAIYECLQCHTQCINPESADVSQVYEQVYDHTDKESGYNRYLHYAETVKAQSDPLSFLVREEMVYFPIQRYLQQTKQKLDILEVGCGYGYLTYAMRQAGHACVGIDISVAAIGAAEKAFGDHFAAIDLELFATQASNKFDLIVATELIEHLQNPEKFLKECKQLLRPKGVLIITTPNRDYYPLQSIWQTELPPIHFLWASQQGISSLAQKQGLSVQFTNFNDWIFFSKTNHLTDYMLTRSCLEPVSPGHSKSVNSQEDSMVKKIARHVLVDFFPLRLISNLFYRFAVGRYQIMGVVLSPHE
jgi:2-polyprenyl-3-methyl-5-hydroxy-6-metoxy-1,4-benzoquinol methylase